MRRRYPLLIAPALTLAAAAPASAAQVEVKGLDALTWDKPQVTVAAGDTVVWSFAGTQQPHNVASGSPNWTYRTELGAPPSPSGSFTFTTPGVYHFVCEIHATTMVGDVTVTDAAGNAPPPPAPPPPGQQPFPNPATPPDDFESGGLDRKRPKVSRVRLSRVARGARVRFRVSERSRVSIRLKRGGRTVETRRVNASGRHRVTIRDRRGLRAGRYRVVVRAQDLAGNRSRARTARIRLG